MGDSQTLSKLRNQANRDSKTELSLGSDHLTDEVYRIAEATNDDGTVDVTIDTIYKNEKEEQAVVQFFDPEANLHTEKMDWPQRDSDEYKLVRICRRTVGKFTGLGGISEETIKADPETWEIQTSETSRVEKIQKTIMNNSHIIKSGMIVLGFLLTLSVVLSSSGAFLWLLGSVFSHLPFIQQYGVGLLIGVFYSLLTGIVSLLSISGMVALLDELEI